MSEQFARLERNTRGVAPEAFAARYRRFLTDVQTDL